MTFSSQFFKITLISNPETILVRYSEGVQKSEIIADMTTFSSSDLSIKWHDPLTVEISTKSTKEVKQLFEKLNQNEKIYSLHPLYILEDGLEMG